ncbi:MAG: flavodoxin family protein [Pseudomonadota bacterium]
MKVGIFYGSETGNSEMVCYDIEGALKDQYTCEVRDLDDVQPSDLSAEDFYILVVSTHGDGDLPIPADHFVERVKKQDAKFDGVRFAIFGMGDTLYDATYNWGSAKVAKLLTERNATQIGVRGLHDASSYEEPEEVAVPWVQSVVTKLFAEAA